MVVLRPVAVAFICVGVIWLKRYYLIESFQRIDLALNWMTSASSDLRRCFHTLPVSSPMRFGKGTARIRTPRFVLYVLVAILTSAAWLPVFLHLYRHPARTKSNTLVASEVYRPAVGIRLYALGTVLGWFVAPVTAIGIFLLTIAYYAWTSEG